MSELTIFSSLLGLDSSWEVSGLELALAENSVKIHVVHVGSALLAKSKSKIINGPKNWGHSSFLSPNVMIYFFVK